MGRAGIVLGLEVSRLARNNADWHRLLEICAMSGTLICDEVTESEHSAMRQQTRHHDPDKCPTPVTRSDKWR